ncbi:hypothetical protein ANCCAN_12059 [Ancylostoma caninum]|uniref:Major facilitator superfamily (MFS) profile domain-containing protein n=1 Tax=Ancylostoma caninum TaxID=29170 RepID=A0A368GC38_ANCCA|nr:hypothetical protein ANCCAN_12059 [Ancylostoma caninum]
MLFHHASFRESTSEDESAVTVKGSFAALSSKEWITVVMLALANLCSTVAFSCIAPFYPDEAKKKGMTESQTGIVFGIFELVMFVTAPVFGRYMTSIGSKNMFTLGLAITGITAILFGLVFPCSLFYLVFLPPLFLSIWLLKEKFFGMFLFFLFHLVLFVFSQRAKAVCCVLYIH